MVATYLTWKSRVATFLFWAVQSPNVSFPGRTKSHKKSSSAKSHKISLVAQKCKIPILSHNGRNIPDLEIKGRNIPFLGSAKSQRIIPRSREVANTHFESQRFQHTRLGSQWSQHSVFAPCKLRRIISGSRKVA